MYDETAGPMTRRRIPHYTAVHSKTSYLFIILNIFRMTKRLIKKHVVSRPLYYCLSSKLVAFGRGHNNHVCGNNYSWAEGRGQLKTKHTNILIPICSAITNVGILAFNIKKVIAVNTQIPINLFMINLRLYEVFMHCTKENIVGNYIFQVKTKVFY